MPGMFYTLQEVIEKLKKTEAEIKTLVREGKLREFRDGAKQLYKTEDVEALAATPKGDTAILDDSLQIAIDETGEISLAPEEFDALMGDKQESKSQFKLDETGELLADETLGDTKQQDASKTKSKSGSKIPLASAEPAKEEPAGEGTTVFGESKEEKITDGDTKIALSGDSISVLGESDTEFKISEDTSGETKLVKGKQKALDEKGKGEAGAARLDEDVNLESFGGSGSGLLDLSLQADDTSLGAVLDDIYPESPTAPVEQTPAAPSAAVAQEAEKIFEQAEPEAVAQSAAVTEAAPQAGAAIAAVITEPPPDAASNAFGLALFVPLVVLVYTAIVVTSGYKPIINLKILSLLEPIIWYVAAGAAAVVILITLIGSFMPAGGNKQPKPPKTKEPKPVKEKKVKKEKKAKKEKETPPAKEQ